MTPEKRDELLRLCDEFANTYAYGGDFEPVRKIASALKSLLTRPEAQEETPRTDRMVVRGFEALMMHTGDEDEWVRAEFARQLERELSAKREGFVFPAHKCELSLTHNAHLNSYQHVCAWIDDIDIGDDEWAAPGEKDKAIATNELWCLQWYPDTPVGFHRMFASTLDVLLAAATKEGQ